jgi:hypothetical protein
MRNKHAFAAGLTVAAAVALVATQAAASAPNHQSAAKHNNAITFQMKRSTGVVAANCLKGAQATVHITHRGQVEAMDITASHLPPNREFDLFIIQVPDTPFGMSWYQGDLQSDRTGHGRGHYVGRFSIETFMVAPGTAPAPVVHSGGTFPDANMNPATLPVHMFHLGLWFGSPRAAVAAGCPNTLTPFNGDHRAGIQALSTRQFPKLAGPLRKLQP